MLQIWSTWEKMRKLNLTACKKHRFVLYDWNFEIWHTFILGMATNTKISIRIFDHKVLEYSNIQSIWERFANIVYKVVICCKVIQGWLSGTLKINTEQSIVNILILFSFITKFSYDIISWSEKQYGTHICLNVKSLVPLGLHPSISRMVQCIQNYCLVSQLKYASSFPQFLSANSFWFWFWLNSVCWTLFHNYK